MRPCKSGSRMFLIILGLGFMAGPGHAFTYFNEQFAYPNGSLTTQSGGTWIAHSGSGSKAIQVNGG